MDFFDLHCDTPYECYVKSQEFSKNTLAVSACKGAVFNKWHQTFAVWIKDDTENPYQLYKNILKDFKDKLKNKPENLTPVFAVEGGAVIESNIDRLYELKTDGIRFLTLTWNGENLIAGGSKTDKGLTDFGKDVIGVMNSLKIGCDLSHLNDKSFYGAIEKAEFPLATHSNCRLVCNHPRNLNIEQIKLIAEKGGVVGLCFYPCFLGCGDVFEQLYKNIFVLCDKGYENNIAIGSDFDGAEMDKKLDRIDKLPDFYEFLRRKGLKEELLSKIFYKNAENFIAKLD